MEEPHSAQENSISDEHASLEGNALSVGKASAQEKSSDEGNSSCALGKEISAVENASPQEVSSSAEYQSHGLSQQRHYSVPLPRPRLTFQLQFISSRGNEYFCEVDEEYLTDRFNLTGLNMEVSYYQYALDLITDVFDYNVGDELREQIEKSARQLYGLIHARYIVTTRGLAKMVDKYKKGDFGKCPRVFCDAHPLLPMGNSDIANVDTVKLYCPKCEDTYNPKSSRHAMIDGAFFGSSFHNMLFQVYPALAPEKSIRRYEPCVYGFRVHAAAALARWQDGYREQMQDRLRHAGVEAKFIEESETEEDDIEETEEDDDELSREQRIRAGISTRMDIGN